MSIINPFGLIEKEHMAVARLKTAAECAQFSHNMQSRPDLVQAANNRVVELRLESHANDSAVIRDAWSVLYAYEQVLYLKHGKHLQANHTRKAINNHGMLGAVENIVARPEVEDDGFSRLVAAGMPDKTFEALVLRHPEHFSEKAVRFAQEKINNRQYADTLSTEDAPSGNAAHLK